MTSLLRIAGAASFLIAVFLNAFVDLGHKIAIQNTVFKIYEDPTQTTLMAIVNALILLPFVLLLSPAGFIGDRYPKVSVMRTTAWLAVVLTCAITVCYYQGWFIAAFVMTFLLAAQSAFYSPAKYGYLKVLFGKEHLGAANGAVQAVTIVAILAGTVVFSELFEGFYGGETSTSALLEAIAPVGWLLIGASLVEVFMVYRLPQLEHGNPAQRFDWAAYRSARLARDNIARLKGRTVLKLSILGLATFWSIAQVVSVAFQTYVESEFGLTDTAVITQTIGFTGIGIVLGSVLAARASRNHIETGLIPLGAAGVALGLWLLPTAETVLWQRVTFLFLGTAGALFIVPLNALIQFNSGKHELGRILAASNWFQNLAMVAFLGLTALFAEYGMDGHFLLTTLAVVATVGGCYTVYKLPQSLIRYVLATLIQQHYRVRVQGLENVPSAGGVLLLGNHVSWMDWAIVQIACPRRVRFVMAHAYYDKWYWRWLLDLMGCIPIQGGATSRATLAVVAEALDAGHVVCIFPEGTITRTGHLAEFKRGYETAARETKTDIAIVPFYLRGLWGSPLSRSAKGLMRRRASGLKRDVIVAFGAPLAKDVAADVLKRRVFDQSMLAWQTYSGELPTLPQAWIDTVKRMGSRRALGASRERDHGNSRSSNCWASSTVWHRLRQCLFHCRVSWS
jgi:acyl-[acyl-carrier-protein]-phospholipid O-acyltransferase/long-chain-fatty-acid--[acyl-carrier-protein] ligase